MWIPLGGVLCRVAVELQVDELSPTVAVGQEEQPLAWMRRAHVGRSEQIPLDIEPERGKVGKHSGEPKRKMPGDVLAEEERRFARHQDAADLGPEVPGITMAEPSSGVGVGLTRISGHDEIHSAAPRARIKGSQAAPDRSRSQGTALHRRDQSGGGERLPLQVADRASRAAAFEAEVEAADAGAEGEGT